MLGQGEQLMKLSPLHILVAVAVLCFVCAATVRLHHVMAAARAMECSAMLHGVEEGTLVPLTKDASIEIGACMLQFNQPIGEDG